MLSVIVFLTATMIPLPSDFKINEKIKWTFTERVCVKNPVSYAQVKQQLNRIIIVACRAVTG
jgi:hypothetical protein